MERKEYVATTKHIEILSTTACLWQPVVSGERCACHTSDDAVCPQCYGTHFAGGYTPMPDFTATGVEITQFVNYEGDTNDTVTMSELIGSECTFTCGYLTNIFFGCLVLMDGKLYKVVHVESVDDVFDEGGPQGWFVEARAVQEYEGAMLYWKQQVQQDLCTETKIGNFLKTEPYTYCLVPEENGRWSGYVFELSGCFAEGCSYVECMNNLNRAAESWLLACLATRGGYPRAENKNLTNIFVDHLRLRTENK